MRGPSSYRCNLDWSLLPGPRSEAGRCWRPVSSLLLFQSKYVGNDSGVSNRVWVNWHSLDSLCVILAYTVVLVVLLSACVVLQHPGCIQCNVEQLCRGLESHMCGAKHQHSPLLIRLLTPESVTNTGCHSVCLYMADMFVSYVSLPHRFLDQSGIAGPLPPSFGDLLEVQTIQMSFNYLTGPLPASWGKLRFLQAL